MLRQIMMKGTRKKQMGTYLLPLSKMKVPKSEHQNWLTGVVFTFSIIYNNWSHNSCYMKIIPGHKLSYSFSLKCQPRSKTVLYLHVRHELQSVTPFCYKRKSCDQETACGHVFYSSSITMVSFSWNICLTFKTLL